MEKYSKQKEEIFKFIKSSKSHPTAEEVYINLKETNPNISRGTVYRNLNILLEKKIIRKISISNMPDRFDYIDKPHSHVICTECGNVYDIYCLLENEETINVIKNQNVLESFSTEFTIYGICKSCKEVKIKEESRNARIKRI